MQLSVGAFARPAQGFRVREKMDPVKEGSCKVVNFFSSVSEPHLEVKAY